MTVREVDDPNRNDLKLQAEVNGTYVVFAQMIAQRPFRLYTFRNEGDPIPGDVVVLSFRVGRYGQLITPIPLAVFVSIARFTVDSAVPGTVICIALARTRSESYQLRLRCVELEIVE